MNDDTTTDTTPGEVKMPTVPPWVDLDAIVPEKLRRRALEIAAELDGDGFELPPILAEAVEVYRDLCRHTNIAGDSRGAALNSAEESDSDAMNYADAIDHVVSLASGAMRLHMALHRTADRIDPDRIGAEVERRTD